MKLCKIHTMINVWNFAERKNMYVCDIGLLGAQYQLHAAYRAHYNINILNHFRGVAPTCKCIVILMYIVVYILDFITVYLWNTLSCVACVAILVLLIIWFRDSQFLTIILQETSTASKVQSSALFLYSNLCLIFFFLPKF